MLHELVYTSVSTQLEPSQEVLEDILAASRRNNLRLDITGVLFYEEGAFVQLLEGPREAVRQRYYEVIAADGRHRRPTVCWESNLAQRNFSKWQMGFARAKDLPPPAGELAKGYLQNGVAGLAPSAFLSPAFASTGRKLLLSIYANMAHHG